VLRAACRPRFDRRRRHPRGTGVHVSTAHLAFGTQGRSLWWRCIAAGGERGNALARAFVALSRRSERGAQLRRLRRTSAAIYFIAIASFSLGALFAFGLPVLAG
jgi:hypothetical protein